MDLAAFPTEELSELALAGAADVMRGRQAAAEAAETRCFGSVPARKVGGPVSNRHAANSRLRSSTSKRLQSPHRRVRPARSEQV